MRWTRELGELELEGLLRVSPDASTDAIDVIGGVTLSGEQLCLTDCHVKRLEGLAVQDRQTWTVNATLVGTADANPQIMGIEVRSPDLRAFYGAPHVSTSKHLLNDSTTVDIRWTSARGARIELADGAALVLDDDWQITGTASDLTLTAQPCIGLLSSRETSERELAERLGSVLLMIGIFSGSSVDEREVWLILPDERRVRSLKGYRPVVAPLDPPSPWLALGNLDPLERTIPAWLALQQLIPRALPMLAEYHRAGPATPWEDRLLYLARFIEQYHRARHDSLRMSKGEFRARRKQIHSDLGGELGEWTFSMLEGANERRLAERLQELVDDLGEVVNDVLPDATNFGAITADTRNYYTHYSDYLEERAAKGWELVLLTKRLWAVVRALVLRELGFSASESRAMLNLDGGLAWLVLQARERQDEPESGASGAPCDSKSS